MSRSPIALFAFVACGLPLAHAQQQAVATDDAQIVKALAPELAEVRLSTEEALTPEQRAMFAKGVPLGFRFEQDLNGDGVTDLLLLGDYQDGLVHSTFALIATKNAGQWVRAGLLTFREPFIVGQVGAGGASVAFCLGCDYGGKIKWTGSGYAFEGYDPGPKVP